MILRPRQRELVDRAKLSLKTNDNTLAVAVTGFGKTICLSKAIEEMHENNNVEKSLCIQHRDELTRQNQKKFRLVTNGKIKSGVVDGSIKDWNKPVTFGMVQTLVRNLDAIPKLDFMVIDEAHHARADSYLKIVNRARDINPDLKILGLTATPNRGDKKGLKPVFNNVCDQVTIREMIDAGHLVPPVTYSIDLADVNLSDVKKTSMGEYDMRDVESIMNIQPINDDVVRQWKEKAGDRQTIIFASTVEHCHGVKQAFDKEGISSAIIHGKLKKQDRKDILEAYDKCKIQVLINVFVLTEGWDNQPTSCVILLRPSSFKGTFVQMIGRGLRTVNPSEYPGIVKNDCVVMDFGRSTLEHGSLDQDVNLNDAPPGEVPKKPCPKCGTFIPINLMQCPVCDFIFEGKPPEKTTSEFVLTETDLLKKSSFYWCDVHNNQNALIASGFRAWAGVFLWNGNYFAIGGRDDSTSIKIFELLASGERIVCLAKAEDWMNTYETNTTAIKSRRWLHEPISQGQKKYLNDIDTTGVSKYQANCLLKIKFNHKKIISLIKSSSNMEIAA